MTLSTFCNILCCDGFDGTVECSKQSLYKGPFKNYVILLGGGGEVTIRLHKITMGGEGVHQKITLDYRGEGSS